MRALITGARGLLGAALVEEYSREPTFTVHGLTRGDVDLRDRKETFRRFEDIRPDVVVHTAALVAGIKGNTDAPADHFYENLLINSNVVEAARRAGSKKIVALGSVAVYSDLAPRPMREEDIWIGPPHPSESAYGHAKRSMLAHLEAVQQQYGTDFAYCVLTNTFGPNDRFDEAKGHVIPALVSKFVRGVASGSPVEVWGTGSARRDFIFASDAARAIRLAGEQISGPVNIASGETFSIAEVVAMLRDISGFAGEIVWDHTKPEGQKAREYDVSKLRALGFRPEKNMKAALDETFHWLRAHASDARR